MDMATSFDLKLFFEILFAGRKEIPVINISRKAVETWKRRKFFMF
jgi:hypothetical protein